MEKCLWHKLRLCPKFEETLKNIPKDMYIVEMNGWGDTYWGVCNKTFKGQNKLGLLLMKLRDKLQGV